MFLFLAARKLPHAILRGHLLDSSGCGGLAPRSVIIGLLFLRPRLDALIAGYIRRPVRDLLCSEVEQDAPRLQVLLHGILHSLLRQNAIQRKLCTELPSQRRQTVGASRSHTQN